MEDPTDCSWCKGTGKIETPCPVQHHGHNVHAPCGRCEGTGKAARNVPLTKVFPEGMVISTRGDEVTEVTDMRDVK